MNSETITEKIINYIKINKVSTTEVADCLDKSGVISDIYPVNAGLFRVGKIHWVYAYDESNWDVHELIRDVEKGEIVFLEEFNCSGRAIVGELVTKFLILYKQAEAFVINGKIRDAHNIIKEKYPVWCTGFNPVGCFNKKNEKEFPVRLKEEKMEQYNGAVMVCDDTGVVVIPKEKLNEDFYNRLEAIEAQEDIWFDCIDRRKWDTFQTVCLKQYKD